MQPLVNGEAAKCGQELVLAQNVRERDHTLQVTGQPVTRGSIAPGARLLAMVDGHSVTCSGSVVSVDGQLCHHCRGSVVGAHAIGPMMVIVASGGVTYLSPTYDWLGRDESIGCGARTGLYRQYVDPEHHNGILSLPIPIGNGAPR